MLAGIDNEQTRQCKKVVRRKRIQRLEISANIAEVYGASVSRETVFKIRCWRIGAGPNNATVPLELAQNFYMRTASLVRNCKRPMIGPSWC